MLFEMFVNKKQKEKVETNPYEFVARPKHDEIE